MVKAVNMTIFFEELHRTKVFVLLQSPSRCSARKFFNVSSSSQGQVYSVFLRSIITITVVGSVVFRQVNATKVRRNFMGTPRSPPSDRRNPHAPKRIILWKAFEAFENLQNF